MSIPAETIEQQLANIRREEDDNNLDAQYADPDFVEAKKAENRANSPYSNKTTHSEEEIKTAKVEEASEPDPEVNLFAQLESADNGKFNQEKEIQVASIDSNARFESINKLGEQNTIPDTIGTVDNELYNPETPAGQTRTRMAERFDEEIGGNSDLLEERLSTAEGREKNTAQAEELLFSSENLSKQIALSGDSTPDINSKINQDWIDANIGPEGTLRESFERIEGNFVLPERLDGKSLSEINSNNPQDSLLVNEAIADAFELEIHTHTLKGKVNYPREKVQSLIEDIQDKNTTPFDKLKAFGEIHTLVNTSIGKGGKQQTEAFRRRQKSGQQASEANSAFQTAQNDIVKNNTNTNPQVEEAQNSLDGEKPKGGDIYAAGDIDLAMKGSEAGGETTT